MAVSGSPRRSIAGAVNRDLRNGLSGFRADTTARESMKLEANYRIPDCYPVLVTAKKRELAPAPMKRNRNLKI